MSVQSSLQRPWCFLERRGEGGGDGSDSSWASVTVGFRQWALLVCQVLVLRRFLPAYLE